MTRVTDSMGRPYRSQLRAEQAKETRARILDGTIRVMAGGIASVSIPAIAREAGVSVPTIYRHFGTKHDLLVAVYPHLVRRAGFDKLAFPTSAGELRDGIRAIFARIDSLDDLARAAAASPAADEARRAMMPKRLEISRQLVTSMAPDLPAGDQERIVRLVIILTSSAALRMWRDHLGSSPEQAADDVEWLVRAAIAAAGSRDGP